MIRKANINDLKTIYALEQKSFDIDGFSLEQFRHLISKAKSQFLVYLDENNHIIGYIIGLTKNNAKNLRIYSVAVDKKSQKNGIGKALFLALEKAASNLKLQRITLEVRKDRNDLLAIYKHFGYKEIGIIPNYYQDKMSAIKMQKII